jgi:carboxyl-terminal processing protease
MEQQGSSAPNSVKNVALGMLGMFVGALIFIFGITVGALLAQPGGLAFNGASPFSSLGGQIEANLGLNKASAEEQGKLNTSLINDVINRLNEQWYGELPSNAQLTDGAIKGMVSALGDQFTQYVEPRFAKILNDDITGSFDGIGATLKQTSGGGIQIVRTFAGTPAERGGVLAGDVIESVNDTPVFGLNSTEVSVLVRGPRGSDVKLKLRRENVTRPVELTLVRDRISIPIVTNKMVGDGSIGYISLFDFSQPSAQQLKQGLQDVLAKNPKGLILDLRGNGGGLLSQSLEIGDMFLKKGPFVIERDFKGNKKVSETTDAGIAQDIPMVVLVDGGSASASEIVAGALQDYERATLIGERTFGKGSVQSPQMLPNGGQLRVTIERWYTPKDRAIHGTGVTPNYTVENSPADVRAGKDLQLEAAVAFLTTGAVPKPTAEPAPAP